MKMPKILLVEDDLIDAMTVERSLRNHGVFPDIYRAHEGEEALNIIKNDRISQPYTILLDIQLPKKNGFEVLEELSTDPHYRNVSVYILSTSSSHFDLKRALEYRVLGYFNKDSHFFDLVDHFNSIKDKVQLEHLPFIEDTVFESLDRAI